MQRGASTSNGVTAVVAASCTVVVSSAAVANHHSSFNHPTPLINRTRISTIDWQPFIAGATGGCIATTITSPLEIIKTRLQTRQLPSLTSLSSTSSTSTSTSSSSRLPQSSFFRHVAQSIFRHEGVLGFWRGLTPSLIGVIPARAMFFGTYTTLKGIENPFLDIKTHQFLCAALAGSVAATLTCPIWVLKTRIQLMPLHSATSNTPRLRLRDVAREMLHKEGYRAFFKGLTASYWGVTEGAIQMVLYEELKPLVQSYQSSDEKLSALQLFTIAATAKLIAAGTTYPLEVVRTRLRDERNGSAGLKYRGIFQSLITIGKEEGRVGLYGGMTPHLLRVVPNAAILYGVVEWFANNSSFED